jgi:hypothetical protein
MRQVPRSKRSGQAGQGKNEKREKEKGTANPARECGLRFAVAVEAAPHDAKQRSYKADETQKNAENDHKKSTVDFDRTLKPN